jgi:transcriptional regulator with XRE-family HTH domain
MTVATFSYKAVGQRLRSLRESAGLLQVELGARLGLSGSAISHLETAARRPSLETLFAWSSACGRPLTFVWAEGAGAPDIDADPACDLTRLYRSAA